MGFDLVVMAVDDVSVRRHQRNCRLKWSYCRFYTSVLDSAHVASQDCLFVPRGPIQQVTAIGTEDERSNGSHGCFY